MDTKDRLDRGFCGLRSATPAGRIQCGLSRRRRMPIGGEGIVTAWARVLGWAGVVMISAVPLPDITTVAHPHPEPFGRELRKSGGIDVQFAQSQ